MNTSEVLNKAADVIQRDGWHRNGYAPDQTENGTPIAGLPVCAMGALYQAADVPVAWDTRLDCWAGFGALDSATEAAGAIAGYLNLDFMGSIPHWNDAPGRTATEVVEALRACAVIEAAKETADEREPVAVSV